MLIFTFLSMFLISFTYNLIYEFEKKVKLETIHTPKFLNIIYLIFSDMFTLSKEETTKHFVFPLTLKLSKNNIQCMVSSFSAICCTLKL